MEEIKEETLEEKKCCKEEAEGCCGKKNTEEGCCDEKKAAEAEAAEAAGESAEEAQEEAEEATPEDQIAELNDKYVRLMAEYQNFRRRTDEEKSNIAMYANEKIARELLNVVDNFERALASTEGGDGAFRSGIELIYKQLMTVLTNFGVEPIEAEGKPFDPNFHNAVLTGEEEGVEPDMVIQELQKGYMLKDRVLRPSMVKVSA